MRRTSVVVLLLLSLLGVAAPAHAGFGLGRVFGVVTDAKTGAPLTEVGLELIDADGSYLDYTSVNGSGEYEFNGVEGQLTVRATDYSGIYLTRSATASVPSEGSTRVDLALTAKPTLSGRVTDTSGNPVAGLCPRAFLGDPDDFVTGGYGCTDETGAYRFGVEPGTYTVQFLDDSGTYADQWWQNASTAATAKSFKVGSKDVTGINGVLAPAASITTALRETDGTYARGCVTAFRNGVYAGTGCTVYDESEGPAGPVVINGLQAGTYTLQARAFGYEHVARWLGGTKTAAGSTTVTVATDQDVTAGDITVPLGGKITAHVVSAATGQPVLGVCGSVRALDVRVGAGSSDPGVGCDDNHTTGTFTITGLEEGSYPVEVVDAPYESSGVATTWLPNLPDSRGAQQYAVTLGGTVDLGTIALQQGGTLSGRVTLRSGAPVPPTACLVAYSAATHEQVGGGGCTDADGRYTITGLGTNDYKVELYAPGDGYTPVFYPRAKTFAKAKSVHVNLGAATTGIDVVLS